MVAQHSWFTVHRYSTKSKGFVPLEKNAQTKDSLVEYTIAADKRQDILRELDRCGINESTLFPDLGGLCQYLNWKHSTNPDELPRL